ncbi:MAG: hypothetical protein EOP85_03165, partial [Verrucomicrobiaceae bacterium]
MKGAGYNIPLILVFIFLLTWKVVRTDWIVVWPWVSCDMSPWSRSGPFDVTYRPTVSPAWRVPQPSRDGREYPSWEKAIPREFSHVDGPTGPARIRPDWLVMALKIGFPLGLFASPAILRLLLRKRWILGAVGRRVVCYLKEVLEESRR